MIAGNRQGQQAGNINFRKLVAPFSRTRTDPINERGNDLEDILRSHGEEFRGGSIISLHPRGQDLRAYQGVHVLVPRRNVYAPPYRYILISGDVPAAFDRSSSTLPSVLITAEEGYRACRHHRGQSCRRFFTIPRQFRMLLTGREVSTREEYSNRAEVK